MAQIANQAEESPRSHFFLLKEGLQGQIMVVGGFVFGLLLNRKTGIRLLLICGLLRTRCNRTLSMSLF